MYKVRDSKKFCFVCSKSFPASKGVQVKHINNNVRTIHKTCAKKLLAKDILWQLYTPSTSL